MTCYFNRRLLCSLPGSTLFQSISFASFYTVEFTVSVYCVAFSSRFFLCNFVLLWSFSHWMSPFVCSSRQNGKTKSSPIGDDWVARYLLRSIKLQFHVLTLLFHCVEMNTKWNELPDEQTQQSNNNNSNQQTKPSRRFQSVETKSIRNRFVQDVQIMLRVTKKYGIFCTALHIESTCSSFEFSLVAFNEFAVALFYPLFFFSLSHF